MTQRLLVSEVPIYLRAGEFFRSLAEDNDAFQVPVGVTKPDPCIHNTSDLRQLLLSLRFWMVECIPKTVIEFVLQSVDSDLYSAVAEFELDLPYLRWLWTVRSADHNDKKLEFAIKSKSLEILTHVHGSGCVPNARHLAAGAKVGIDFVQYLVEHGCQPTSAACAAAARLGHLECLEYLHTSGAVLTTETSRAAAKGGHLHCLRYLRLYGCSWDASTTTAAAYYGRLSCLTYLHQQGCPWDATACTAAAGGGHLASLQYLHEHGCPREVSAITAAARRGMLGCLTYCHAQGCPWDATACAAAASRGELCCLQYLHSRGCPWDSTACALAAEGGHLSCLQYAHANGCPINEVACVLAARAAQVDCLRYALGQLTSHAAWREVVRAAAQGGSLACLQLAHERFGRWDAQCCSIAAHNGQLDCLQYLLENGCPFMPWKLGQATPEAKQLLNAHLRSRGRPLDLRSFRQALQQLQEDSPGVQEYRAAYPEDTLTHRLMFLFDCGVLVATAAFDMAVTAGSRSVDSLALLHHLLQGQKLDVRMLRRLVELTTKIGSDASVCLAVSVCPPPLPARWAERVCGRAMLEALKALHGRGCPLTAACMVQAARWNKVDLLRYLHEHGCPWSEHLTLCAACSGSVEALQFAHEHGCPWSAEPLVLSRDRMGWYEKLQRCAGYYIQHGGPVSPETARAYRELAAGHRRK